MPITCTEMAQVITAAQARAASLSIIADVTVECVLHRRAYLLVSYGSAQPPDETGPDAQMINVVRVWEPHPPRGLEPVEYFRTTNAPLSANEEALKLLTQQPVLLRNVAFIQ